MQLGVQRDLDDFQAAVVVDIRDRGLGENIRRPPGKAVEHASVGAEDVYASKRARHDFEFSIPVQVTQRRAAPG